MHLHKWPFNWRITECLVPFVPRTNPCPCVNTDTGVPKQCAWCPMHPERLSKEWETQRWAVNNVSLCCVRRAINMSNTLKTRRKATRAIVIYGGWGNALARTKQCPACFKIRSIGPRAIGTFQPLICPTICLMDGVGAKVILAIVLWLVFGIWCLLFVVCCLLCVLIVVLGYCTWRWLTFDIFLCILGSCFRWIGCRVQYKFKRVVVQCH